MFKFCGICGQLAKTHHFGAISCRACAAFFRRKVVIRNDIIRRCNGKCDISFGCRKLCPSCRMEKCLKAGMTKSKVMTNNSDRMVLVRRFSTFYEHLQKLRHVTFAIQENHTPSMAYYKQVNEVFVKYGDIIRCNIFEPFPETLNFPEESLSHLLNIFTTSYIICEGIFRSDSFNIWTLPNDDLIDNDHPEYFYKENDEDVKGDQALEVSGSYWKVIQDSLRSRMVEANLDQNEFFLFSSLLFWDCGLHNQSNKTTQTCENMRKKVIEELSEYENLKRSPVDAPLQVARIVMILQGVQTTLQVIHGTSGLATVYDIYEHHRGWFQTMGIKKFCA